MKNNYTVYMHISPSNKRYIGITSTKIEERWRNGKGYKHNKHFTNAINKYGWDNFEHIIIAKDLDEDVACWLEIELIKIWNSTNKKYGYNISLGGGGAYERSEETKRKISESKKGKYVGKDNPNYGNYWSDEQKQRMSEIKKREGCWKGENNPMYGNGDSIKGGNNPAARKVICLETMEIFDCIKDILKKLNGKGTYIYVAIKKHKKYKGYTFIYYEDYLKMNGEIDNGL